MVQHLLKNRYIRKLNYDNKIIKFIFFQNPMDFNYNTFYIENINPKHIYIVYAKKKDYKHKCFIRIAILVRG
jgi:hypothetical protein